ncbi:MAG: restriction endonuclease subunit S [Saprospiraceae bacterium]|nr:restriction endonuclease subunit S [Saprospiraceae bacterium]
MSKKWEIRRLSEICENLDSKRIPITKNLRKEGKFPYYGASGIVDYVDEYIFDEELLLVSEDGANLLARTYPIAFSISGKSWVNNHAHVLRFSNKLSQRFVEIYLNSIALDDYVSGMAQPKLNQAMLNSIEIPFPPLPEQKQIVTILDKDFAAIDKAKANTEKNLQNAKDLFESYLQNVFANPGEDWEEKKLNEISQNLDSKRIPITKSVRSTGNYPYYGASGIVDYVSDFIFEGDLLLVSEDGANLLARTYPIAFSISGKTWVNNHAHVLRFSNLTNQKFVEYYLNSIKLDDYVSGMAQPKLNQAMLNTIPIPYPPLKVQTSIINKFDILSLETKKLESIYQQKLNDLEELKKSILQKAFAGELTTAKELTV